MLDAALWIYTMAGPEAPASASAAPALVAHLPPGLRGVMPFILGALFSGALALLCRRWLSP